MPYLVRRTRIRAWNEERETESMSNGVAQKRVDHESVARSVIETVGSRLTLKNHYHEACARCDSPVLATMSAAPSFLLLQSDPL